MSRKNFITFVVSAVCVVAAFLAILIFIDNRPGYRDVSISRAFGEVPELEITKEEYAVLLAAFQEPEVQQALKTEIPPGEKRNVMLSQERAKVLFSAITPANAELGVFAIIDENMYIDYILYNDRFIYECDKDQVIRKSLARFTNIKDTGANPYVVYRNIDNTKINKY